MSSNTEGLEVPAKSPIKSPQARLYPDVLNAGVVIDAEAADRLFRDPVALGIIAGLALGKPIGLWAGVRLGELAGIAERPAVAVRLDQKFGLRTRTFAAWHSRIRQCQDPPDRLTRFGKVDNLSNSTAQRLFERVVEPATSAVPGLAIAPATPWPLYLVRRP